MKRQIIVTFRGKQISIENPSNIEIRLKDEGCRPFKFKLRMNKYNARKLARALKRMGRRPDRIVRPGSSGKALRRTTAW